MSCYLPIANRLSHKIRGNVISQNCREGCRFGLIKTNTSLKACVHVISRSKAIRMMQHRASNRYTTKGIFIPASTRSGCHAEPVRKQVNSERDVTENWDGHRHFRATRQASPCQPYPTILDCCEFSGWTENMIGIWSGRLPQWCYFDRTMAALATLIL